MGRISFERGVPSAAIGLAGTGTLVVADPWSGPWMVGWGLIAASAGLFGWGFRIGGKPWWRALKRPSPQLYLSLTADRRPNRDIGYIVGWSTYFTHLGIVISDYPTWSASIGEKAPAETRITLYLLNAGPEDARHLNVTWNVPGLDVVAAVKDTGIFGEHVHQVSPHRLILTADGAAASMPLTARQMHQIPLLKAGETIKIESPEAFTYGLSVALLALGKTIRKRVESNPLVSVDAVAVLAYDRQWSRPLPRIEIAIEYETDHARNRQGFVLCGRLNAGGGMPVPTKEGVYEIGPESVQVFLDALVIENEQG